MSWHVPLIILAAKAGLEPAIHRVKVYCLYHSTTWHYWRQVGLPTTHLTFNLNNNGDGVVTALTHVHWLAVVSHFVIISTSGGIDQNRTDNQGHSTAISLHAVKLCRLSYYPVLNSAIGLSPMGDKVGFGCASLPTVSIDQSLIVTCLFHISYF